MGTLYDRITSLCKSKGVSGSRMCLDLGLSKSTMSDLKNGRIKGVSIQTAQKIAGYFGITVDELYGEEVKKEQPTTNGGLFIDGITDMQRFIIEEVLKMPEDRQLALAKLLGLSE